MAMTKINFYLGFLLSYASIIVSTFLFLSAMVGGNNIYMDGTQEYVNQFTVYVDDTEITQLSEADTVAIKNQQIITTGNETGESSVTDNLAVTNYYSSRINYIGTYISLTYNAPSFIAYTLIGENYESVRHLINILSVIIFMGVLILFVREVRG